VKKEQIDLLVSMVEKGKRALASAEKIFEDGDYDFASSRAYYAVFHFMQAALFTKELVFSKHSANITEFSKIFVKNGIFPKEFGEYVQRLFSERQIGDYSYSQKIDIEEAEDNLRIAREVCEEIEDYLKLVMKE
jgi:uncharacterized protein (UPF0332 family)